MEMHGLLSTSNRLVSDEVHVATDQQLVWVTSHSSQGEHCSLRTGSFWLASEPGTTGFNQVQHADYAWNVIDLCISSELVTTLPRPFICKHSCRGSDHHHCSLQGKAWQLRSFRLAQAASGDSLYVVWDQVLDVIHVHQVMLQA